jgi:hypothetical protein
VEHDEHRGARCRGRRRTPSGPARVRRRAVLLRQGGTDGAEVERNLRRLLPLKTKAEYDPDDIAPSVAAKAVERAQRCAVVARRVASTTT